MENISEHITWAEATKSQDAIRKGLDNTPEPEQLANMKLVAEHIFEPLREYFGKPIGISSFFRSVELNKSIGGSPTSDHCNGCAIDIDGDIFGSPTNKEIFDFLQGEIFDQLIHEFGDDNKPSWVHVSYRESGNRNQVLRAIKQDGKTKYIPYENKVQG